MRYQKHSNEFKMEAVRLAQSDGMSVGRAARDLGISESVLRDWIKKFGTRPGVARVTPDEREELMRLRRELRIVKEERDILKKATAFFARESQ